MSVSEAADTAVSRAGGVLLVETARTSGLDTAVSAALAPWRCTIRASYCCMWRSRSRWGNCLAGAGMLRAKPDVVRPVASDPTVSRLIDSLAAAAPMALDAVRTARPYAREYVWKLAPNEASGGGG